MKKTLLYGIFALSIASATLTSCEDMFGGFLDKQPSNELTGEEVFSDWNLMLPTTFCATVLAASIIHGWMLLQTWQKPVTRPVVCVQHSI